ncbi:NPC intracellular cholesterol transporter 2-like [Homarus americanus]|uniref:NPC intracellular cholesterol transporter 2-like 3 n=1 Tax=Homarus americanus TaxID=6706 RepID=A0A8J5TEF8_HOMAM|nr:NPC intracellular cholesterol transporter 2-like [Homarus americanus]KAG7174090.1 NPC intracellular cholesterol transporter 2-like 3 [Homarus americanus]
MHFSFIILAGVLGVASATIVQDCGSTAELKEVSISNCGTPPCVLKRGEDIIVDINFDNNVATETLTTKVTGTIGGIEIPWLGVVSDACTSLIEGDCPLEAGEEVKYSAKAPVLNEYPAVIVIVTWKLKDHDGKTTVCFVVPAQIV